MGRSKFDDDEMIQVWVTHHLQIIGEAANKISIETREYAEAIPWEQIIGMRNILVHDYFGINLDIVWSTAVNFLPYFKSGN